MKSMEIYDTNQAGVYSAPVEVADKLRELGQEIIKTGRKYVYFRWNKDDRVLSELKGFSFPFSMIWNA